MMNRLQKKADFIRKLAEFLSGDAARKSIELEMGKESAKEWAALRNAAFIYGWPDVDETEKQLLELLG